jgi:hypothetical protein
LPDTWISRLVVSGPTSDLARFRSSVNNPEAEPATSLSFRRLQTCLSEEDRLGLDQPMEPWDDSAPNGDCVGAPDEQVRPEAGMLSLEYNFSMARYEPDELLIRASRLLFPRLCLVLGWVAPSNDEHRSRFIHNGQTLIYDASVKQVHRQRSRAYRGYGLSYDDALESDGFDLSADLEGDWALLKVVVAHWDATVHRELERLTRM